MSGRKKGNIISGTSQGGLKTRDKNLANDPDHYKKLGKLSQVAWERNGRKPRGFATMTPEKLKLVSAKGGRGK